LSITDDVRAGSWWVSTRESACSWHCGKTHIIKSQNQLKLSSEKRREDEAQREKEFIEANSELVTLVKKWAPRELGRYRCRQCKETLDTSVAGMERHLEAHTNLKVMKLYRNPNTGRFHPGEQYFRPGGYVSCPNSLLHCYVIKGKRYGRGDKWQCGACAKSITWEVGHTGQMGARIMEKIENHIRDYETHGHCEPRRRKTSRKKLTDSLKKPGKTVSPRRTQASKSLGQ
jgi:hypothetical protein